MVEYLTRNRIQRYARGTLTEQASTVLKAGTRSPTNSTFLSHSTKDSDLLPGVISLLEEHGVSVYVDKKDEKMPPYTSDETADILRSQIQSSKNFILLATPNSKDSRWMPWELGLSDGFKGAYHTAILPSPSIRSETAWAEQEYLGIYRRIVYGRHVEYPEPVYMVWNMATDTATELKAWLGK